MSIIFEKHSVLIEGRVCGTCSACCKTHGVPSVQGVRKPPGKWCQRWENGCGCSIYVDRPEECRSFRCEWLKGFGEDKHRPDRTKVVLDFVIHPDGPDGGILQIWELNEGSLTGHVYAKEMAAWTLMNDIFVSFVYLSGRRRLFVPPSRESPEAEGLEICSALELLAA